jgi:adenylate kinase family enzyme
MLKVIVIGCPGAGKSVFSKKISNITNYILSNMQLL